jgi:DNA (cytosine-5)-methyltransferase 1
VRHIRSDCQNQTSLPKLGQQQLPSFSFIDLFAGIGGMRVAFEGAGGNCVFTSEWNKFAQETYRANFGDEPIAGDITEIPAEEIPGHDVLVAGFPCQPFSIAGVSKKNALGRSHGFSDETQGTLFFDVARIIEHHRPAAFLLENVKNLRNHDKGRTFEVISRVLTEELGYSIESEVIDARALVPQHRERIFIVGLRDGGSIGLEEIRDLIAESGPHPKLGKILHPGDGSQKAEEPYTTGPEGKVGKKYTLTPHLWNYLKEYAAKHRAKGNGFGYGLVGPDDVTRTLSARYYKDGSEILVRQKGKRPRRLTPRECARLMGFDRPRASSWRIPVSDTQAYRQFGNAVVPGIVSVIAEAIEESITADTVGTREPLAA